MKLGVCVPYRNREEHLARFVPEVGQYLENQGIDYCMYFGHQKDDKLFNRGATKNIAAKAAFEDGCDYIVWHDIDMIPEVGGGADYSCPSDKGPVHIATNISQMNYKLKYFEYFGGAVLFTRDQVEKTNGYSNDYWDWGMEDDDLFWRSYLEGLVDKKVYRTLEQQEYFHFGGDRSWAKIPVAGTALEGLTAKSHTISILCRAFQQPEKNQIYLIGDENRRYVEYPVCIIPGQDYGIQFNNSKAFSVQFWNTFNKNTYMWAKRYDRQWTYITATFDAKNRVARLFLNGKEVDSSLGEGSNSPVKWLGHLRNYEDTAFYLGTSPSIPSQDSRRYFLGDIADIQIFNRDLSPREVKVLTESDRKDRYALLFQLSTSNSVVRHNVSKEIADIEVPETIIPYRKPGRFLCLPHEDEGIVNNKFKKDFTKHNEERYQLGMQQGKIDYKKDGINQVKYKLLGVEEIAPKAKMINVTL